MTKWEHRLPVSDRASCLTLLTKRSIAVIRHVVLIVIDCLRADHVSCYGYHRKTTPTLDAIARQGLLWENARSASSWTKPSVASIFTGLHPSQHGTYSGIKRSKSRSVATTDMLPDGVPTLAEGFTTAGWRTAAFANNAQLDPSTRLDRGFTTFEPRAGKADSLIERYLQWLDAADGAPSFAYLHFLEAHWPYKPRARHVAMFGGDRDTNKFRDYTARDYGQLRRELASGEASLADADLTDMVRMYDGSVRRLDGKVTEILGSLAARGLYEQTVVAVTADHGEEFLEHGSIGHGHTLYNELIGVPLILKIPGERGGQRFTQPVSLVNLPCTLLRTAGIDAPFPGSDLRIAPADDEAVCCELRVGSRVTQTIEVGAWKLHRTRRRASQRQTATSATNEHSSDADTTNHTVHELYHLQDDPLEQRNVIDENSRRSIGSKLQQKLDDWAAASGPIMARSHCEADVDERVVQRIRDLGYID